MSGNVIEFPTDEIRNFHDAGAILDTLRSVDITGLLQFALMGVNFAASLANDFEPDELENDPSPEELENDRKVRMALWVAFIALGRMLNVPAVVERYADD